MLPPLYDIPDLEPNSLDMADLRTATNIDASDFISTLDFDKLVSPREIFPSPPLITEAMAGPATVDDTCILPEFLEQDNTDFGDAGDFEFGLEVPPAGPSQTSFTSDSGVEASAGVDMTAQPQGQAQSPAIQDAGVDQPLEFVFDGALSLPGQPSAPQAAHPYQADVHCVSSAPTNHAEPQQTLNGVFPANLYQQNDLSVFANSDPTVAGLSQVAAWNQSVSAFDMPTESFNCFNPDPLLGQQVGSIAMQPSMSPDGFGVQGIDASGYNTAPCAMSSAFCDPPANGGMVVSQTSYGPQINYPDPQVAWERSQRFSFAATGPPGWNGGNDFSIQNSTRALPRGIPVNQDSSSTSVQPNQTSQLIRHFESLAKVPAARTPPSHGPAGSRRVTRSSNHGIAAPRIEPSKQHGQCSSKRSRKGHLRGRSMANSAYPPQPAKPANWGEVMDDGLPLFSYNERAEWLPARTFSAAQLTTYVQSCPRDLKLWLQRSPAQCNARLDESARKCRWDRCPAVSRKITAGWYRVAFDEYPEETTYGDRDPFLVAGSVHLWCFEQCFDPVIMDTRELLHPDCRGHRGREVHKELPREHGNPMALSRDTDKFIIERAYRPWMSSKMPSYDFYAPIARKHPHEESLSCALVKYHIMHQPKVRQQVRDQLAEGRRSEDRMTIEIHQGDLGRFCQHRRDRRAQEDEERRRAQEAEAISAKGPSVAGLDPVLEKADQLNKMIGGWFEDDNIDPFAQFEMEAVPASLPTPPTEPIPRHCGAIEQPPAVKTAELAQATQPIAAQQTPAQTPEWKKTAHERPFNFDPLAGAIGRRDQLDAAASVKTKRRREDEGDTAGEGSSEPSPTKRPRARSTTSEARPPASSEPNEAAPTTTVRADSKRRRSEAADESSATPSPKRRRVSSSAAVGAKASTDLSVNNTQEAVADCIVVAGSEDEGGEDDDYWLWGSPVPSAHSERRASCQIEAAPGSKRRSSRAGRERGSDAPPRRTSRVASASEAPPAASPSPRKHSSRRSSRLASISEEAIAAGSPSEQISSRRSSRIESILSIPEEAPAVSPLAEKPFSRRSSRLASATEEVPAASSPSGRSPPRRSSRNSSH